LNSVNAASSGQKVKNFCMEGLQSGRNDKILKKIQEAHGKSRMVGF